MLQIRRWEVRRLPDRRHFGMPQALLFCFLMVTPAVLSQTPNPEQLTIPSGTPIEAKLTRHIPMKVGQPVQASLAHPVYTDNKLAIPAGAMLQGAVVSLEPNRELRNDARLNADFTPYHRPTVTFTGVILPGGINLPLSTTPSSDGAPVIRLAPPAAGKRRGLVGMGVDAVRGWISSTKEAVIAPGLGDRMVQLLYHQLPYHPERIQQGTMWTCELRESVSVPAVAQDPPRQVGGASSSAEKKNVELHAYLDEELSSSNAKVGQQFQATVAEPVQAADHSLLVPQGAVLVGTVTRAKPARSFHRDGSLRFDFRQLQMPGGSREQIIGSVTGLEANAGAALKMDSEGGVKSQPQGKVIVPFILTMLANHVLDADSNLTAGAAVGSNGMGLIGRVVGMAAASRNLAAGIGFYGAGVSVYRRWLRHGRDITFPKDNRIDIEMSQRLGQQLSQQ
jgi:hypothetical protein